MRYFLDTEFNGFGGALISVALVPEHGDQEFYAVLPLTGKAHPWVARNVVPFLHTVPPHLDDAMSHREAGRAVAAYLEGDRAPEIVADWPEDIALFCRLLMPSAADVVMTASIVFHYYRTPGFKTAAASKVPHNALHDARALRDFVLSEESLRD